MEAVAAGVNLLPRWGTGGRVVVAGAIRRVCGEVGRRDKVTVVAMVLPLGRWRLVVVAGLARRELPLVRWRVPGLVAMA